jgi:hypothetical protein
MTSISSEISKALKVKSCKPAKKPKENENETKKNAVMKTTVRA